jgi:hypothetical protein
MDSDNQESRPIPEMFTEECATCAPRPAYETATLHQVAIKAAQRLHPEIKTSGFVRTIKALWAGGGMEPDDLEEIGFTPDAYRIDADEETVWIYEVEDTSRINTAKMVKIGALAWDMDAMGWSTGLVIVDRWGKPVTTVDAMEWELLRLATEVDRGLIPG